METFEAHYDSMFHTITKCIPGANTALLQQAVDYASRKHEHQQRKDGSPYIIHPLAVAEIVAEMGLDVDAVLGALLHDCIEDTDASHAEIEALFGQTVAELVEGVTKLTRANFNSSEQAQMENLRKMFMAMSKDIRVVLIKIADRLHNMRTMQYQTPEKQISKCQETMDIYAPLAHRLGMQKIKWELEDIALRYLDPEHYNEIMSYLNAHKEQDEAFMHTIQDQITQRLSNMGIQNTTYGRIKHVYSIYRKMNAQGKTMDELFDVYAFRCIVDTIPDCYNVLGHIHDLFNLVPGRFKDYISTPKPNMYQSLHTTVIGSQGIPFEVQIRTWDMHETAEYGIAAHWKYKQGGGEGSEKDFEWVRRLLESQQDADAEEYVQSLKIDMFDDEVFVFTPKGRIVSLPAGSTPIDFAYMIHSGVGNSMIGAKIMGRIANIDTPLNNGDIVEVITSKAAKGPSRDWLNIVRTSEARNKIRQWFKREKRADNIIVGKAAVDSEVKKLAPRLPEAKRAEAVAAVAARMGYSTVEDLYNSIGYGELPVTKTLRRLKDELDAMTPPEIPEEVAAAAKMTAEDVSQVVTAARPHNLKHNSGIVVDDAEGCAVKFAKCCNPLPGDDVVGFVTKGFGISIHKQDCPNYVQGRDNPDMADRWKPAHWEGAVSDSRGSVYEALLQIHTLDTVGVLADITVALADMKVSILQINSQKAGSDRVIINLKVSCKNVEHYYSIVSRLRSLKNVLDVVRGFS